MSEEDKDTLWPLGWRLFVFLFLFRLVNCLLLSTYFVPDEYYQSVEVAHEMVFGYGHLTWEWRRDRPMRTVVYPGMFALPLYLLKVRRKEKKKRKEKRKEKEEELKGTF